ncbi:MAG: efflux RND transporter permease subunit [Planctomycetota bacterium]|nr:efflux RND transporter permease subunit [Planctomycetota bacterium]
MIRYFAEHPTAANLLMVALMVLGLLTLPDLKRETMPDFSEDRVQVTVVYPGASAADVEEAIARRLEDALDGIDYVDEVRTESREGVCLATADMSEGGSIQVLLDDIRTEIDAITDFPDLVEKPIITQVGRVDPVLSVAVTGAATEPDLKAYCEDLKERLQNEAGVRLIEVRGFSDHQYRVEISAFTLAQFGVSAQRVADVLASQSIDLPAGLIETKHGDILLRFKDERRTVAQLEDIILVGSPTGGTIRLGDVARITDRFERPEASVYFNEGRAGVLAISKTKSQDALDVAADVRTFLAAEKLRAPENIAFTITEDVTSIVEDRLDMLVRNGWQGLLLVFVVMALFFNLRFSFWVAAGLPVSFLGALWLLPMLGVSINMISMVALLLALGLLMDDAIVLAENIAAHLQRGSAPMKAVVDGVTEVRNGVLSSFLTTVCVFGPLIGITGSLGKVLRVMPIVLILVLAVSLIEAFLILPHHLGHGPRAGRVTNRGRFRKLFDGFIEMLRDRLLGPTVDFAVRWRYLVLGMTAAALLFSIAQIAGGVLKVSAFPAIDGDVIEARILLPQGTPLERTRAVTARVTAALGRVNDEFQPRQPGRKPLVRNVQVAFNRNLDAFEEGPHVATVIADLLPAESRRAPLAEVLGRWRAETGAVPDVIALKFKQPSFGPAGQPLELRLGGGDLVELKAASQDLQGWLGAFPGVVDLDDDLRPGKLEVRLRLRPGALGLGLDARSVAGQLRGAFFGTTAREMQVGHESIEVDVRLDEADRATLAGLDNFRVTLPDGALVPLPVVAEAELGRSFARIARVNGRRTVTVRGDVDRTQANIEELLAKLHSSFVPEFEQRHPGVTVSQEGEAKESADTNASMLAAFALGLLGVFILLSFQFRSWIEPVIVMVAIPLSLIGVIWGHILLGYDLTMPSIFGFVSLAGVVVNDSILLVSFAKNRLAAGLGFADAARQASRQRFRAVLLTSLTTVAGLTPLMLEKSLQAQFLIPLAVSIVFGMLASTLLVLLVIPCMYSILGDLGLARAHEEPAA